MEANEKQIKEMQAELEPWKKANLNRGGYGSHPYGWNNRGSDASNKGGNGKKGEGKNKFDKNNSEKGKDGKKGKGKAKTPQACFDNLWGMCSNPSCSHPHYIPTKDEFEAMKNSRLSWAVKGLNYEDLPAA
ncbi:unnamed protein product [Amoebophrya sp. A25]|nr:unnamed protein product [Amoebophrya sp. A25]|eukprot:GSA25T00000317001.1